MNLTPRQQEILEAVQKHGSHRKAAKALGINKSNVTRGMRLIAAKEPALHQKGAPIGYGLRGVSTLLGADGEVKQTWVKTARDAIDPALFLETFKAALESEPLKPAVRARAPREILADLLVVYPMGDPHLGMLAWARETGENFDLAIAERHLVGAVDKLVGLAPAAETALIINLGDFFHADNFEARTARSGHALDVDTRWPRLLQIGITTMVRCIDRALEKHKKVRVINEIGNHDDHSAIMLSICLSHHYRNEPRVDIDTSPAPFHWHRFGANLIGVTHGHNVKLAQLPGIMAVDRAQDWGETAFRYFYTGHVHHESAKEFPGCLVETFGTLAAKDAWTNAHGYRARRKMVMDVVHKNKGRICRHEIGVEAL